MLVVPEGCRSQAKSFVHKCHGSFYGQLLVILWSKVSPVITWQIFPSDFLVSAQETMCRMLCNNIDGNEMNSYQFPRRSHPAPAVGSIVLKQ